MTTIRIGSGYNEYKIEAEGHATGSVQVCAAISAVLYALDGYLENSSDIEIIRREMDGGKAFFHFKGGKSAKDLYDYTAIGLMRISHSYPEYAKSFSISW